MTLDYQTRAQDFAERHLNGDKLELTYPDRLSLTALLIENGFELEGNADDFEIKEDFNQNREYLRLRKEGEKVVGFDRLAPLDLFANPQHPNYREKQKSMAYTLLSGEGDDAYNHYIHRVSDFHDSLLNWRRAQKDYNGNAPDFFLTDVLKGLSWGLALGAVILPVGSLIYSSIHPDAAAWLSNGWVTVPTGFVGVNAFYHAVDQLIDRPLKRSNRRKAERNMDKYQDKFDSKWEEYKRNYLPAASFDQEALRKALGVE